VAEHDAALAQGEQKIDASLMRVAAAEERTAKRRARVVLGVAQLSRCRRRCQIGAFRTATNRRVRLPSDLPLFFWGLFRKLHAKIKNTEYLPPDESTDKDKGGPCYPVSRTS